MLLVPIQALVLLQYSHARRQASQVRRYARPRSLARELAAEAIAEQVPQPPFARAIAVAALRLTASRDLAAFNDPRRRSFPSILEDSPLQDDSITPVHSTTNGLKPMTPLHPARATARARGVDGMSMAGVGSVASHSDPTKGLVPKEMFLGLGGSPYPSLPPPNAISNGATFDGMDPFGIPLTQESSPFDATMAYANKTSVYHTPNQVAAAARIQSNASQTSLNGKRRPVLTMTMNDPKPRCRVSSCRLPKSLLPSD